MLKRLLADRPAALAAGLGLTVLAAATAWFFTSASDRGPTAALSADGWYYHAWLPTLVYDRDVDFRDEYAEFGNFYCFGEVRQERPGNPFGVGPAMFELPFFLAGAGLAKLAGAEVDGFSRPEVVASMLASLLFSLGALFFAWRLIRRRLGAPYLAIAAPLLVLAGGPVVYYAIRQPGYAHPFATFFVAWLVDFWDSTFDGADPRSKRSWLALGALFGLAVLARTQLAFWGVLLAIAALDDLRRAARSSSAMAGGARALAVVRAVVPAWIAGAAAMLVAILPQALVWKALYGELWLVPQGSAFLRWDAPAWSETLFSSRNGLFAWAPVYALALIGLLAALRRAPRLAGALLLGVALQALANGAAWDWWAGGSFGGRRFDSCYVAFAFGLAALAWPSTRPVESRAGRFVERGWAAVVVVAAGWLALANVALAARTASHTARIGGGKPAPVVLREKIPRPLAGFAAAASSAATWAARAWFARAHDVPTATYDYVAGIHQLEERYPGLNCEPKPPRLRLRLSSHPRRLTGFVPGEGNAMRLAGERGRILLGFNRHGPVELELGGIVPPAAAPSAEVVLRFNGEEIARARLGGGLSSVAGTARDLRRGVNTLELEAPPGTQLRWLEISGPPTALGGRAR